VQGKIFNIERFALHDGPGIRTTIFLQGCPLFCPWCHNPESRVLDQKSDKGFFFRRISLNDLFTEIEKDILFFNESGGGVTFSGGEPLSQEEFLAEALKKCRERKIYSAVDTCGVGGKTSVDTLALADLILFDIKGLNSAALKRETGASAATVSRTLDGLVEKGQRIWLRLPLIPGYGLLNEPIDDVKAWLSKRTGWFEQINVLPFHRTAKRKYEKLGWRNPLYEGTENDQGIVMAFVEKIRLIHSNVRVGG